MTSPVASQRVPDILDCLAQLSNDEVPTPPKLARAMLDALPDEVWSNSDFRWLDPCSKSGIFLREIAARLLEGLAGWEPDFEKRRAHIYREMLWGASITEMTGIISRRTLYCSRDASGEHSVVRFDSEAGHLPFVPAQHEFNDKGRCTICGAPEDLERGESRENYAYSFIHGAYPTKELEKMKFDVIVGNPPYMLEDGGHSASAVPIYHRFVQQALSMEPRYVVMITPSRWFAGGRGLDAYRKSMLSDRRLRILVDYLVEKDAFPGVNVNGGVSYFLWDRSYSGPCSIKTILPGGKPGITMKRPLDEFDLLIRRNEAIPILRKVLDAKEDSFSSRVSSLKPFGLRTYFHGKATPQGLDDPVKLYGSKKVSWVERSDIPAKSDWVDSWKVLIPAASDGNEIYPLPIWDERGPFVSGPGGACTETYLVASLCKNEAEADRIAAYMRTRLFRFLVSLRKIAQHNKAEVFAFVPDLPMKRRWTDELLYDRFGLNKDEAAFIESQIREMPTIGEAPQ